MEHPVVDRSTTNDGMWDVCPFFLNSQQRAGGQAHLETKAIKKKRKWHHYIRSICYAERFKNTLQGKDELLSLASKRQSLHFHKALIVKVWLQAWFWGMHDPKTFLLKLCFISLAKTKWGLKKIIRMLKHQFLLIEGLLSSFRDARMGFIDIQPLKESYSNSIEQ